MSHASYKIAVCRRNGAFALCEYSHISAKARTAGGGGNDSPRLYKCFDISSFKSVEVYFLRCGDNDDADSVGNLFAFEYLCGNGKVGKSAVGAGAYYYLIYLYISYISYLSCVFGKVREGDRGFERGKVYFVCLSYSASSSAENIFGSFAPDSFI